MVARAKSSYYSRRLFKLSLMAKDSIMRMALMMINVKVATLIFMISILIIITTY